MGRFKFELATRDDDAELRSILAATPMDGQISLSFRREPSFFDAAAVEGDFHQVAICRDSRDKRIAGFGCRSVRMMYVNGQPTPIGYLSALRALPEYRNRGLVARGYAFLHQLHADGRTSLYLTTITAGNEPALAVLTSGRAGLPTYRFAGTYHTMVISIGRRRFRNGASAGVDVRSATNDDLHDVLELLRAAGPSRQFFPCYEAEDFFDRRATFRDLTPADLLLAFRDGQLVGTLGGWNQRGFKQSVVERYAAHLRWSRPLYNSWARLRGMPMLPPPGKPFHYLTGALPVVLDDDPAVFRALLEGALAKAVTGSCDFLVIGLHESDPLLPLAKPYQLASYLTGIYLVSWDQGEPLLAQIDDRPAYLELGCL
ncbi:MAG: hypothetical protein O3C40_10625 [Planctomycetota bacterium]|nr:hypothetical protein [Planctomycetota bacterium]